MSYRGDCKSPANPILPSMHPAHSSRRKNPSKMKAHYMYHCPKILKGFLCPQAKVQTLLSCLPRASRVYPLPTSYNARLSPPPSMLCSRHRGLPSALETNIAEGSNVDAMKEFVFLHTRGVSAQKIPGVLPCATPPHHCLATFNSTVPAVGSSNTFAIICLTV